MDKFCTKGKALNGANTLSRTLTNLRRGLCWLCSQIERRDDWSHCRSECFLAVYRSGLRILLWFQAYAFFLRWRLNRMTG